MLVQQHCFQESLHQMITLGSGMVSGLKHHYHEPRAPQQSLTIPPDFVGLLSLYRIADAVKALSWIFFMYFLLSEGERTILVKNVEVELVMKP